MILAPEQVAALALNLGMSAEGAARAVAVARYESGFNTEAHNSNARTGDDSYGLWQINMYGSLGPARRRQWNLRTNEQLLDPQTNAEAMKSLAGAGGDMARHWPNTWRQVTPADLAAARTAVNTAGGNDPQGGPSIRDRIIGGIVGGIPGALAPSGAVDAVGSAVDAVTDPLAAVRSFLGTFTAWGTWARVLQFLAGAGLVAVGLALISRDTITEALSGS